MNWQLLNGCDHPGEIAPLFDEYTHMLVENDPAFQRYLDLQNYGREVEHLAEKYGPPRGKLYLVRDEDGQSAGCIALRPLDETRCEMKRLYVRPAFRGRGLARFLVERIIADARALGYREMLLDTLPFLTSAIDLYRKLGFRDIPCYNNSPLDETIYLGLAL